MKNIRINQLIKVLLVVLVAFSSCDPMELDKPDAGFQPAPTAEQLDFTISPGEDEFHFVIENTSSVNGGLVTWDFGNGSSAKGNKAVAYYPLPGEYTIKITVSTNGGSGSTEKMHTTTETDYSLFDDPMIIAISGGAEALEGKTWVIDSTEVGHLGVGPANSFKPDWWGAQPLEKSGHYIYDDEFTFKLVGFEYIIDTKGVTHANGDGGATDKGIEQGFYTGVIWEDQYDKDVTTDDAARGNLTWSISKDGDKSFIGLNSYKGVIGYDGGNERVYEILSWTENSLYLRSVGGAARYHKLIPKGYEKPKIDWDPAVTAGTGVNEFDVSVDVLNIPAGESIDNIKVDFGDGSVQETTDVNEVLTGTYMRKGNYVITVTATTSLGVETKTQSVEVLQHHPDYQEFLLDEIVMYADFSEVALAPVEGENCSVTAVENPDRIYPNKSERVGFYSKTNQEWANAFLKLPDGYRYDLRLKSVIKLKVYGKAGQQVLLKFENTDRGGNAWQTGAELVYTIQEDDTWEVVEYDFDGVSAGWDWTGDIFTSNIVEDDRFNHDFYNIIRIMLNPGVGSGTHEFYFDELAGPHVEGIKSGSIN